MENQKIIEKLCDKKINTYNKDENNFVIPTELTVTITLNEYRALVSQNATRQKDIDDANKNKYEREVEIKSLKEENARLKGENYDLKSWIDELNAQIVKLKGEADA